MAAGRPILGLAPRDAALHELLADSGAGICAEPNDIDAIARALEITLFGESTLARSRIDRFRWSNIAQQYLAAIDAVTPGSHAAGTTGTPSIHAGRYKPSNGATL
jgi:glycosyltransferase involved in cell wall biosynthesis